MKAKKIILFSLAITFSVTLIAQQDCDRVDATLEELYRLQSSDLDSAYSLSGDLISWVDACSEEQQISAFIRHASLLGVRGDFEESLTYAILAHQQANALKNNDLAVRAAGTLGSAYSNTGDIDLAEAFYKEAMEKAEQNEVLDQHPNVMINYGILLFTNKHDTLNAVAMLEKAEKAALKNARQDDLNTVRHNLASIYAMMGQLENSKKKFLLLNSDPAMAHDLISQFYIDVNLGYVYEALFMPDSSLFYFKKAHKYAMTTTGLTEQENAKYGMYSYFKTNGQFDSALFYFEQGKTLSDSALNEERVRVITGLREDYEADLRENEIVELEQLNRISDLQRNFFIVLAFLMVAVAAAIGIVLTHRRHLDRLRSEQRILELEKEKEVMSLQTMLFAQEEERQRIARDLHDSIGALLSAARLHINNIEEEIKKLTHLDFLGATSEAIDRASKEVRRVAHDMMPGVLMKLGLLEGIEDFFERMRASTNINFSFTYDDFPFRLGNKSEVMIYRMVQELVQNSIKHAGATEVKLMIKWTNNEVVIDYRDDGQGFDAAMLYDQENFGLTGLKSRVNFLNGRLDLKTAPGFGVHYTIFIPATPSSD